MPEVFKFAKHYEDRNYLVTEYLTLGKSSKQIGKNLHVSYKLIEIWLRHYNIEIRTTV